MMFSTIPAAWRLRSRSWLTFAVLLLFALPLSAQVSVTHLNTNQQLNPCQDQVLFQFQIDLSGPITASGNPFTNDQVDITVTFPLPGSGNYLVGSTMAPTITGANLVNYTPNSNPGEATITLDMVTSNSIQVDFFVDTECEIYQWDDNNTQTVDPPLDFTFAVDYQDEDATLLVTTYSDQSVPSSSVDFSVFDLLSDPTHVFQQAWPNEDITRYFTYVNTGTAPFIGQVRFVDEVPAAMVTNTGLVMVDACVTLDPDGPGPLPAITNCPGNGNTSAFNVVSVTPINNPGVGGTVEIEVIIDVLIPVQNLGTISFEETVQIQTCTYQGSNTDITLSQQTIYYGCPNTTCTDDSDQISLHQATVEMELGPRIWLDYVSTESDPGCIGGTASRGILYTLRPNYGHADILEIWIYPSIDPSISNLDLSSVTLVPYNSATTPEAVLNTTTPSATQINYITYGTNSVTGGPYAHGFQFEADNGLFKPGDQLLLTYNYDNECVNPDQADPWFAASEVGFSNMLAGGRFYRRGCNQAISRWYPADDPCPQNSTNPNGCFPDPTDPLWPTPSDPWPYGPSNWFSITNNITNDDRNHPTTPQVFQAAVQGETQQGFINGPTTIQVNGLPVPVVPYCIPSNGLPIDSRSYLSNHMQVDPLNYAIVAELVFTNGLDYDPNTLPTPIMSAQGTLTNPMYQTIDAISTCDVTTTADAAAFTERYRVVFPIETWMVTTTSSSWANTYEAQWRWTPDALDFFAGFDIKFSVRPNCSEAGAGGNPVTITERLYLYDLNCNPPIDNTSSSGECIPTTCILPLDEVSTTIQVLCPGCIFPGWNITTFDSYRTNIGLEDANDDNYPDAVPSVASNANTDHIITNDDVSFYFEALFSDGGSNSFDINGNPLPGSTLMELENDFGLFLEYGRLVIQGPLMSDLTFLGATGTYNNVPLTIAASPTTAYVDNNGDFVLELDIADINAYLAAAGSPPLSSTTVEVLDEIKLTLDFKVTGGLCPGGGVFYESQDLDAWIYSAPLAFGYDALEDGATGQEKPYVADVDLAEWLDQLDPLIPNPLGGPDIPRNLVHLWCTGLNSRMRSFCVDDHNSYSALNYSGRWGVTFTNPCEKVLLYNGGGAVGQSFNGSTDVDASDQTAMQAFNYEVRNLWTLNQLDFDIPANYTVDRVEVYFQTQEDDGTNTSTTFNCSFNSAGTSPYLFTNWSVSGSTLNVDVAAERLAAENLATGPNGPSNCNGASRLFLTYDETKTYIFRAVLRFDCLAPGITTPVNPGTVTASYSDYPLSATPNNHQVTLSTTSTIAAPDLNMSATVQNLNNTDPNTDLTWEMLLDVTGNNFNNLGATHGYLYFTDAFGNPVDMSTANIIWKRDNTNLTPFTVLDSDNDGIWELGNVGGSYSTFPGKSSNGSYDALCISIDDYDCSANPGGDITVWFGYNCYQYPTVAEVVNGNTCYGLNTTIDIPDPSADLVATPNTVPSNWTICDNQVIIDINATGLTQVENILAQFGTLPGGVSIGSPVTLNQVDPNNGNAIVNSATINLSNGLNGPEADISNAGMWMDDFSGQSLPLQLIFDIVIECNYMGGPISIDIVAEDYCGAPLAQNILIQPGVIDYGNTFDDVFVSSSSVPAASCNGGSSMISITLDETIIGSSGVNVFTAVLPAGMTYVTGSSSGVPGTGSTTVAFDVTGQTLPYTWTFDITGTPTGPAPHCLMLEVNNTATIDCDPLTPGDCQETILTGVGTLCLGSAGLLQAGITATDISCNGLNDGTVNVVISGGSAPYSWTWANFLGSGTGNTAMLTGVSSGTYTITATDAAGCVIAASIYVTEPAPVVINQLLSTDLTCAGADDGTLNILAAGGTAPLEYSVDGGLTYQTSSMFTGLPAGNYSIVVQDANGCMTMAMITIADAAPITASVAITDPTCSGNSDGQILVTAVGGTQPLLYSLDNGVTLQATNLFDNLTAGTYTVLVQDANGCTVSLPATLTAPNAITFTLTGNDPSCIGGLNGNILVSIIVGGVSPYTYTVSGTNGNTTYNTPNLTGLGAGTYTITVTDANGCSANATYTLLDGQKECCEAATDPAYTTIPSGTVYTTNTVWDNKVYLAGSVTVNGAILDVTNVDVAVEQGAVITLINGATLYTHNSTYRPCSPDAIWAGIYANSNSSIEAHECVVFNARNGMRSDSPVPCEIVNNEFNNCLTGVSFLRNNDLQPIEHSVTGNTFKIDDDHPFGSASFVGLRIRGFNLTGVISQNDFSYNGQIGSTIGSFVGIESVNAGAKITSNNFVNCTKAYTQHDAFFDNRFEGNTIYNAKDETQIPAVLNGIIAVELVDNVGGGGVATFTWVKSNTITKNREPLVNNNTVVPDDVAIYTENSANVAVSQNEISDYTHGIYYESCSNFSTLENKVHNFELAIRNNNSPFSGVTEANELENSPSQDAQPVFKVGIWDSHASSGFVASNINDNCVTATTVSLVLQGSCTNFPTVVRDNLFYDYDLSGAISLTRNTDYGLCQGGSGNFGRNAFVETAPSFFPDILNLGCNASTEGGNFYESGLNPGGAQGLTSPGNCTDLPHAPCGQIFRNADWEELIYTYLFRQMPVTLGNNGWELNVGYETSVADQHADVRFSYAQQLLRVVYELEGSSAAQQFLNNGLSSLTAAEQQWLDLDFHYMEGDWNGALTLLQNLPTATQDDADMVFIRQLQATLRLQNRSYDELTPAELAELHAIHDREGLAYEYARHIIHQAEGGHLFVPDLRRDDIELPDESEFSVEPVISAYPNPATDYLQIEYMYQNMESGLLEIRDVAGRLVHEEVLTQSAATVQVDISGLANGMYTLSVVTNEGERISTKVNKVQ